MRRNESFSIDTNLAALLGESYRSTELALKELIDNAWDADASSVYVSLPEAMSQDPIIIKDDGIGMNIDSIKNAYLKIARNRRSEKGELTEQKNRKVKGRKGIGKFSGLILADHMKIETFARDIKYTLQIHRRELLSNRTDLSHISIPIEQDINLSNDSGTTITLSHLNQSLSYPTPQALRQVLFWEYGREEDFDIFINNQKLSIEDIPGKLHTSIIRIKEVGEVKISFKISPSRNSSTQSGFMIKVSNKTLGNPVLLGLENNEKIPRHLLNRVYGEIEANGLEDDVTQDWGGVITNSIKFKEIERLSSAIVLKELRAEYKSDFKKLYQRIRNELSPRFQTLPESRRLIAESALETLLKKLYLESHSKIKIIVNIVLDALEKDEYWQILQNLNSASQGDISLFAKSISEFGIMEMSAMYKQTHNRLKVLDHIESLICNQSTLESQVHEALENNLWILGMDYTKLASNKTLRRIVDETASQVFRNTDGDNRPDILALRSRAQEHHIIELKRPSYTIGVDDYFQIEKYRSKLKAHLSNIHVTIIGGKKNPDIIEHSYEKTKFICYSDLISSARDELNWLIEDLQET